jgi:GTPase SAR1 family protein
MNITIRKNPEYRLNIPKFKCDKKLKDNVPPPYDILVDGFRFICVVGPPRSGKTSFLVSLFSDERLFKKTFDNVITVIPQHSLNSLDASTNPFKKIPEERRFTNLSNISQIRNLIMFYSSEGHDSILVIDDQASYLKDNDIQRELGDILLNRRHYKCSVILLTQTFRKMPLDIRKVLDVAFVLYKPSKMDMLAMFDELFEMDKINSQKIINTVFRNKYDNMMLEVQTQRFWRNQDELILEDK